MNKNILFLIPIILIYVHLTIGELIMASLTYIWYTLLVIAAFFAILSIVYAFQVLIVKWHILASEARKAMRDIRSFDQGVQVFHFGVGSDEMVHALHLDANTYSNGIYEQPTQEQLAIFSQYNQTFNQQNNYYGQDQTVANANDGVPLLTASTDNDWIRALVSESPHIHIAGETRSGKTTFAQAVIKEFLEIEKGADFWLISPKHVEYKTVWPIEPFVRKIDHVMTGLLKLIDMLDNRQRDSDYHPDKDANQVVIVDDWDWIYNHYKTEAVLALRTLLKVGAELNYRLLLIGQSTLSGDTGLSRSDYNNMTSLALKHESYQLLKTLPLTTDKKKLYRDQLDQMAMNSQRYALLAPYSGLPIVKEIPDLGHIIANQDQTLLPAPLTTIKTSNEQELTIIEMLEEGKSLRETARFVTGKPQEKINSADTNKIKRIAQKHGLEL